MKNPAEVNAIIAELELLYPDAICSLEYKKDYELLFAVRLSAQCTDARVNLVTPALFARFPTLESFARASEEEVGEYVHSCGFWRAKARDLVACAKMLLSDYSGKVPGTMDDLLRLPGVGRREGNAPVASGCPDFVDLRSQPVPARRRQMRHSLPGRDIRPIVARPREGRDLCLRLAGYGV